VGTPVQVGAVKIFVAQWRRWGGKKKDGGKNRMKHSLSPTTK